MPINGRIYFDPPATETEAVKVTPSSQSKDVLGKIAQLVPGEILGAYGAALGTLPLFGSAQKWVGLGCFVLGVLGTAWYVGWTIGKGVKQQKHLVVYAIAFAVWAYSLTGKTVLPWIYSPGVAALSPIIFSVIAAKTKLPRKEIR